jgi:hypothetical protein
MSLLLLMLDCVPTHGGGRLGCAATGGGHGGSSPKHSSKRRGGGGVTSGLSLDAPANEMGFCDNTVVYQLCMLPLTTPHSSASPEDALISSIPPLDVGESDTPGVTASLPQVIPLAVRTTQRPTPHRRVFIRVKWQ